MYVPEAVRLVGWVGLDEEALETKAAPFKIALRTHWRSMIVSHTLSELEILAEEQQRSLVKINVPPVSQLNIANPRGGVKPITKTAN